MRERCPVRGRIIHYHPTDGTGLISADSEHYVFAIGQWRSSIGPRVNQVVEVRVQGLRATSVALVPSGALLKKKAQDLIAKMGWPEKPNIDHRNIDRKSTHLRRNAMNSPTEAQIVEQLQMKRARDEAGVRDTAGARKLINILFGICMLGAIIPAIGIAAVFAGLFLGSFGSLYLFLKGNPRGGLIQILITVLGTCAATVVWAVVTFAAFA